MSTSTTSDTTGAFDIPSIPPIWCPFEARMHPDADGVADHLVEWARRSLLIRTPSAAERFHRAGFGRFSAAVYPRATQLHLVAEWQGHNWLADDQLDEGLTLADPKDRERVADQLLSQLPEDLSWLHLPVRRGTAGASHAASPLTAALSDLWHRTARPMSRAWRRRFVGHYRDFLAFTLLPHSARGRLTPPTLAAFVERRRQNSGCEMSFDLSAVATQTEVPAVVADSEPYRTVRRCANDVISWTNDIFSVRKEMARGDEDHLVAVLRRVHDTTWDEALARAVDMVKHRTGDFVIACDDLRDMRRLYGVDDFGWRAVTESLTDLEGWISGSLEWHRWSPRYRLVETTETGSVPSYIEPHVV
ncbi:terpene synthase family protein [Actinacidiphila rubida]|uniref:Terpene synthase n=1 Tax=Actinacidiphila rubida TaxID=310780 RepID=A0A1H8NJD9_9ACTN|nr:hypothetical protein [Actinacidiphila rubida]SEO29841.1 hypothetical protein SAMN05216267_1022110 [Actinacidiphila rubida]